MISSATRTIWLTEDETKVRIAGCRLAAKFGDLDALVQWFQSHRCHWVTDVCRIAAAGGHLNILQWARSQTPQYSWDVMTCAVAARFGHLEVLQWIRSQTPPCPWDDRACQLAARNGHLEVLRFGCCSWPT